MIPAQNTIPYRATPWITSAIIGLCVVSFAFQLTMNQEQLADFFAKYALVPARFTSANWSAAQGVARFDPTPLATSMFLHGGVLHILLNLWTLWVFGPALEDRMGAPRYAMLYLASGLAAGLAHVVFNFSSAVPTIGASGAIAGVIAAYARRFPYAWVNVLQPIVVLPVFFMMPALLFAGMWFASQVMQGTTSLMVRGDAGGVAWWAHIGGFVAGWVIVGRTAKERNYADEAHAATRSALWPWERWSRWTAWWWRRR